MYLFPGLEKCTFKILMENEYDFSYNCCITVIRKATKFILYLFIFSSVYGFYPTTHKRLKFHRSVSVSRLAISKFQIEVT